MMGQAAQKNQKQNNSDKFGWEAGDLVFVESIDDVVSRRRREDELDQASEEDDEENDDAGEAR